MVKERNMRKDSRALDEKEKFVCFWVNMNLNDRFNHPLPKPYITSYIKTYLILRVVNCYISGEWYA